MRELKFNEVEQVAGGGNADRLDAFNPLPVVCPGPVSSIKPESGFVVPIGIVPEPGEIPCDALPAY